MDELTELLPDEVRQEMERHVHDDDALLETLSSELVRLRDEAVTARRESGIEREWLRCEEAYLGIDDQTRAEFSAAKWAKPMTMEGSLTAERSADGEEIRATAFVPMTARYVDAGTAKVCEIALPIDGRPFTLKATPVPEDDVDDQTPAEQVTGRPMPGPDGNPVTVAELAKHQVSKAEAQAEKAAKRIHDWLVECKHTAEMRKVVHDMARIGVGVIKGPVPEERESIVVRKAPGGVQIEIVRSIKPADHWVDPWDFFPAPGCGEDIQKGGHCFERAPMLEHALSALGKLGSLGYIQSAIDRVINEGPGRCYVDARPPDQQRTKKLYEVWHFTGLIERRALHAAALLAGQEPETLEHFDDAARAKDLVFCHAALVNSTVIRVVQTALDTRRLPYRTASWRRRIGHWAGKGVGEQIRTAQRVCNAAVRAMLSNAGKSSGAQVVMDPEGVAPANQDPRIHGDKLWYLRKDAGYDDVRKVFAAFNWPNTTPQLMTIVEFSFRLAEENSNIPLITQGQSGKTTPDTFGGQQLQDNNANQLLRDVGFGLNDQITAPLIDHYYEWLLLDPDVPDDEKGEYKVDTSGALALIEKALADITIAQMANMVLNPAFGLNPRRWVEAYLRSKRLIPSDFTLTQDEMDQLAKQPPPEDPTVTAAKIRAQATLQAAQSRDALAAHRISADMDRDTAHVQAQTERTAMEREKMLAELAMRERIAMLEYAKAMNISLNDAKTALAKATMELRLQRELAGADGKGPQVAEPAVEPEGRAPEGQAFQR